MERGDWCSDGSDLEETSTVMVIEVVGDRIWIAAGSSAGVQVGDHFDITRAGSYLCTIRVSCIEGKNLASGEVCEVSRPCKGDLAVPKDEKGTSRCRGPSANGRR
jgi:hypothetical protein